MLNIGDRVKVIKLNDMGCDMDYSYLLDQEGIVDWTGFDEVSVTFNQDVWWGDGNIYCFSEDELIVVTA